MPIVTFSLVVKIYSLGGILIEVLLYMSSFDKMQNSIACKWRHAIFQTVVFIKKKTKKQDLPVFSTQLYSLSLRYYNCERIRLNLTLK